MFNKNKKSDVIKRDSLTQDALYVGRLVFTTIKCRWQQSKRLVFRCLELLVYHVICRHKVRHISAVIMQHLAAPRDV